MDKKGKMAAIKKVDYEKEFEKLFENMCYRKGLNRKDAWSTLMHMFACTLSNVTEPRKDVREEREREYQDCEDRLGGKEIPATLLSYLMTSLIENPSQDFLGNMYMELSMGEKAWGQCFTPYHICDLMARLTINDPDRPIDENGFVTIADPCIGGGAMLIAAAQMLREKGYNPSTQMLAVGQDIDHTAVCMAFIQLSIIGCPAVVICDNSLIKPYTGNPLFVDANSNYWYTPALFSKTWNERRMAFIEKFQKDNKKKSA